MKTLKYFVAIAALALTGCATGPTAPQTVAQIEIGYTALANIAAQNCTSGFLSPADCQVAKELNDAIDTKGADGQQHGVLVAARAAAQSGDSVTIAASLSALQQAVAAFTAFEAQKGLK